LVTQSNEWKDGIRGMVYEGRWGNAAGLCEGNRWGEEEAQFVSMWQHAMGETATHAPVVIIWFVLPVKESKESHFFRYIAVRIKQLSPMAVEHHKVDHWEPDRENAYLVVVVVGRGGGGCTEYRHGDTYMRRSWAFTSETG
jgi:hypothetical protein